MKHPTRGALNLYEGTDDTPTRGALNLYEGTDDTPTRGALNCLLLRSATVTIHRSSAFVITAGNPLGLPGSGSKQTNVVNSEPMDTRYKQKVISVKTQFLFK